MDKRMHMNKEISKLEDAHSKIQLARMVYELRANQARLESFICKGCDTSKTSVCIVSPNSDICMRDLSIGLSLKDSD